MKILHTADWHIGKRLERFSRLEEQEHTLSQIVDIADDEDVDLVLVAGDLFDTFNPGSDAQELLYRTLKDLARDGERAVVAVAGNHDSPDRVVAPEVLARRHGIILAGYPDTTVPHFTAGAVSVTRAVPGLVELAIDRPGAVDIPVRILLAPYANEFRLRRALIDERDAEASDDDAADRELQHVLRGTWSGLVDEYCRDDGIDLMVAHLLFAADPATPPEEPESERPIGHIGGAPALSTAAVPSRVQYVACGHLHRPHTVAGPTAVRYSGSPLSYSFSEAGQAKSVTIVEVESHDSLGADPESRERPLTGGLPLVRYHADSVDGAVAWLTDHRDALVELSLTLSEYLSGADRRRLHEAHDRIVTIVPVISSEDSAGRRRPTLDPRGDIVDLFSRFFNDRTGRAPSDTVVELLSEIVAAPSEDDGDTVEGTVQ
ncbi:MAG: exonuclease subunit SbcD [Spirochaetales bacterium]|nr:exonuclease subunit SbcD [Spirochaetales bacterium]